MKTLALTTLLFIAFSGCKKDSSQQTNDSRLYGRWQYVLSVGGISGRDRIKLAAGVQEYLILNSNSSYQVINNGQSKKAGKFSTVNANSKLSNRSENMIIFDDNSIRKIYLVEKDTLYMADDVVEGYSTKYIKSKN